MPQFRLLERQAQPTCLSNSQAPHTGVLLFESGLACVETSGIQREDVQNFVSVTKLNQQSCLVKITIHKDALLSGYHKT